MTFSITTTESSPEHNTCGTATGQQQLPHVTVDHSPPVAGDPEAVFSEQDEETMLRCFVFMLDLLLLQVIQCFLLSHFSDVFYSLFYAVSIEISLNIMISFSHLV